MKIFPLLLAATSLLVTVPAFAADQAPATTSSAAPIKPGKAAKPVVKPEDRLICTREAELGSTIPKRVCKTQAQIDEERRGAESLENQRQLLSNNPNQGR